VEEIKQEEPKEIKEITAQEETKKQD